MNNIQFTPELQEEGKPPISFTLRPLTNAEFGELQFSMSRNEHGDMIPSYKATAKVFKENVVAWDGISQECTARNRASMLDGVANPRLVFWMGAITGKLFVNAFLDETERKN